MVDSNDNLTTGNITHKLWHFFWPLLLANLLQSLYSVIDMAVVGRFVGSVGLAALSNASMIIFVTTSLALGVGIGGTVCIAKRVGENNRKQLKPIADTMLTLSVIFSLFVSGGLVFWLRPLLQALEVPATALGDAFSYTAIVTAGYVFVFAFNAAAALLRGMGDSRTSMAFIMVATIVNVVLNLLLVGSLGVQGVAYATVAAQAAACFGANISLYSRLENKRPAPSLREAIPILKAGTASAVQLIAVNISFTLVTAILNLYGVEVAAASGIGLKLNTFAAMPCWAFGNAITAMTSQCLGAGKIDRAKATLMHGLGLNLVCTAALVSVIAVAAEPLVQFFAPHNPEVLRIGVRYIRLCCSVNCLVYCTMYTFDAFATGAGHASIAMVNSLLDSFFVRLSLGWLLSVYWGYGFEGMYIGQALSPLVPAAVGISYYLSEKWKKPDART